MKRSQSLSLVPFLYHLSGQEKTTAFLLLFRNYLHQNVTQRRCKCLCRGLASGGTQYNVFSESVTTLSMGKSSFYINIYQLLGWKYSLIRQFEVSNIGSWVCTWGDTQSGPARCLLCINTADVNDLSGPDSKLIIKRLAFSSCYIKK